MSPSLGGVWISVLHYQDIDNSKAVELRTSRPFSLQSHFAALCASHSCFHPAPPPPHLVPPTIYLTAELCQCGSPVPSALPSKASAHLQISCHSHPL